VAGGLGAAVVWREEFDVVAFPAIDLVLPSATLPTTSQSSDSSQTASAISG
jgi:hypothetical protein